MKKTILLITILQLLMINIVFAAGSNDKKFYRAIKKGDIESVQAMIGSGADVNEPDKNGFSALQLAISRNDMPMVKMLVENGADIFFQCTSCCNATMLSVAAFNNAYEPARFLLERGADVNGAEGQCMSPLMNATEFNDVEMMNILIGRGADVNYLDPMGQNVLFYVKSLEAFNLLSDQGVKMDVIDKEGNSVLSYLWHSKIEGINELLSKLFYHGAIFATPENRNEIFLSNNFEVPDGFDSLLMFSYSAEAWRIFKSTDQENLPGGKAPSEIRQKTITLEMDTRISDESVLLIIAIPEDEGSDGMHYQGNYNGHELNVDGTEGKAWAKCLVDNQLYIAEHVEGSGYLLTETNNFSGIGFVNLLVRDPGSGEAIRIYGFAE